VTAGERCDGCTEALHPPEQVSRHVASSGAWLTNRMVTHETQLRFKRHCGPDACALKTSKRWWAPIVNPTKSA
jgi:hypothetical protein